MNRSSPPVPDAELIYSRSVETALGPRDVRLYWGDIASVPTDRAVVLISTNVFRAQQRHSQVVGQTWRALKQRFPELDGMEFNSFQTVLRLEPNSSVWAMSSSMAKQWGELKAKAGFSAPAVLVSEPLKREERPELRRVFVAQMLDLKDGEDDDYAHALSACFVAMRAEETRELMNDAARSAETEGPYRHVIMSVLGGQQGHELGTALNQLLDAAQSWLQASPRWRSVDIAYWRPGVEVDDARSELLGVLDEDPVDGGQSRSLAPLLEDLRDQLEQTAMELGDLPGKKGKNVELQQALQELRVTLGRPDMTVIEVGTASGRLAEALVNWLCEDILHNRPKTFDKGIERLGARTFSSGSEKDHLSRWFQSYLHTLRVLRNESVHSQTDSPRQFPPKVNTSDLVVLVASLHRVLALQLDWMLRSKSSS